jgi:hypothetical protein
MYAVFVHYSFLISSPTITFFAMFNSYCMPP